MLQKINFNMETVTLYSCEKFKKYKISKLDGHAKEIAEKLNRIGLRVGEEVYVTNFNYHRNTLLVKIKGVSFALDALICKGVILEGA